MMLKRVFQDFSGVCLTRSGHRSINVQMEGLSYAGASTAVLLLGDVLKEVEVGEVRGSNLPSSDRPCR